MPSADPTTPTARRRADSNESPNYLHRVAATAPPTPENNIPRVFRAERLAEAPSRNELVLPASVTTSQPPFFPQPTSVSVASSGQAYFMANQLRTNRPYFSPMIPGILGASNSRADSGRMMNGISNGNHHGSTEREGHAPFQYATSAGVNGNATSSTQMLSFSNRSANDFSGTRLAAGFGDVEISSCSPDQFVPTPFNTPHNSPIAPVRERGGGPKKRIKLTTKARAKNAKEKMINDPEAVLAQGESPLYDEDVLASSSALYLYPPLTAPQAVIQHQKAQMVLSLSSGIDHTLASLTEDELKQASADFKADGKNGFNDTDFLIEAQIAHALRVSGDFNALLEEKFRNFWMDDNDDSTEDHEFVRASVD
ncbi:hypothetical protein QTJ16_001833 [Diplocarpon rosae]|uniref:Uncharacterized protein n=1 Tax=Diplocarpon rosae TaxID=946125 RepID=A0AAD9T5L7_9HELO|nr:hypothetical protein QTJ16_001833 [Diplocarpon rosae]PBP17357.1 hypothetical protein BUE80_DR011873 [Diplocarpon rosae]